MDIIYASPETLVGDAEWRASIQKLLVSVLVIDEFHTIATWYVKLKIQILFIKFHTELCSLKILRTKPNKSIIFLSLICLEHVIVKIYLDSGIMHVQTPKFSVIKMFTSHKLSIQILYQCLCI